MTAGQAQGFGCALLGHVTLHEDAGVIALLVHETGNTTHHPHDLAMIADAHGDDHEEAGQLDQPVDDHDPRQALERHARHLRCPSYRHLSDPGKTYRSGDRGWWTPEPHPPRHCGDVATLQGVGDVVPGGDALSAEI